ncbi:MAG: acyltransferase [Planctomycetota bacterium]
MNQHTITIQEVSFIQVNGAWIAEDTIIGTNVTIFPGAVLGRPAISTKAQVRQTNDESLPPLIIGDNCVIGANVVLYRGTSIGNNCLLGDTACIREKVTIGDSSIIAMGVTINYDTSIGSRVKIMDNSHITGNMIVEDDVFISDLVASANDNSMGREVAHNVPIELRKRGGPIIRRHATIGQGACILPGIEIGENSIIGANAVVTKSIPKHVLVMGIPARVIRNLREDEIKL